MNPIRVVGQFLALLIVFVAVAYLADSPAYTHHPADRALVKLSFSHGSKRAECRRLTAEELQRLPPNMRRPLDCPRGRPPVVVDLRLDGQPLFAASLPPSGLSGDGPSRVYRRFSVPPGRHEIEMRLRDTVRAEGFDYERRAQIELAPGQNFVVDFRAEAGGFVFR